LAEIETIIAQDGFWDTPEDTKSILKERTSVSNKIDSFKKLWGDLEETQILLDLAVEESDEEALAEVAQQAKTLDEKINRLSLNLMLDGKDDSCNAIVSINAGAGGTEAQDWAEMLFRMYSRWVERKGYKSELIDFQPGDEAGIKSVTFTAGGENAFGNRCPPPGKNITLQRQRKAAHLLCVGFCLSGAEQRNHRRRRRQRYPGGCVQGQRGRRSACQ